MSELSDALDRLIAGTDLGEEEARAALDVVMRGDAPPAQIAGLLVALKVKGETPAEIAGCARTLRDHAAAVRPAATDLVDTAGTGGDGTGSFNISTAAGLLAAAAGATVAKHGNRSVSSRSGSADVLEALGIPVEIPHAAVARMIDELGFGFLYAPAHHGAMRFAGPVRRELGVPTIMNLLGPLANPLGAPHQVVGVARPDLVPVMADVLARLGTRRALVVHGAGGFDEITPCGEALIATVEDAAVTVATFDPAKLDLPRADPADLAGGDPTHNAALILAVFDGEPGPRRDTVLVNAAAALVAAGRAEDLADGLEQARAAIDDGRARELVAAVGAAARAAVEGAE
jgi:anthranilate phosphoribosyltransferase